MDGLISRSKLIEFANNYFGGVIDCNDIARFPTIDAEPVRHGRWIETNKPGWVNGQFYETPRLVCPFCTREAAHYSVEEAEQGGCVTTVLWLRTDYCPNCGAKMDGGDHHD